MTQHSASSRRAGYITKLGAIVLIVLPLARAADPPPPADPLKRTSPQSTVLAFLEACKAKDYSRALHYLDLKKLPVESRLEKGKLLAEQLERVLEHDAQFDAAALSSDPAGVENNTEAPGKERVSSYRVDNQNFDLQLERLKLRSGAMVWKFSQDSVDLIPKLAKSQAQSPLEKHMPDWLVEMKYLDTPVWQWIALLILALAVLAIAKLFGQLLPLLLIPAITRILPRGNWSSLTAIIAPLEVLVAVALFRIGLAWINIAAVPKLYVTRGLAALSILGVAWLSVAVLDIAIGRLRGVLQSTHPRFSGSVLPLLTRVLKVAALCFGIIAVLSSWGYNTNTVLAGLGIGGVAIALAAQKTIENLFGGVAVVSDQPVFVGDFCKFGDSVGTVEDIGLRSTRIRTLDRTLVTIPNAQFSSMSLENYSRRDKMLFHPMLNLRRDTTPEQVRSILDAIKRILANNKRIETGAFPVRFVGVGSYSLDVEVFAYILTGDGDEFLRMQQELLLEILDAISAAGTALALPTQASVTYSPNYEPATR
jgi:MscS family membrane protein